MKESQFKVGDKVVIVSNHHGNVDNEIGVIVSFDKRDIPFVDSPSIRERYGKSTSGAAFSEYVLRKLTPLEELL